MLWLVPLRLTGQEEWRADMSWLFQPLSQYAATLSGAGINLEQHTFRFYADGTENGSSALANQNTNYTADLSGGDFNVGLRVGLQNSGGDGNATDDYKLQYDLNSSGTWVDVATPPTITVSTATPTTFTTSVTSMPVNLPSVSSGDLLIAVGAVRNPGTWTVPTGWTVLNEQAGGGSVGETVAYYRIADGSEGSTATWTAGTATTGAWHVRKITNWHGTTPPEYTSTNGDSASVNPSSITPSWSSSETAFIAFGGSSADVMSFTGAPTNYSDLVSTTASTGGGASNMGSASRVTTASTEDPGTFTTSTNRWWSTFTIAVRPQAIAVVPHNSSNLTDGNATTERLTGGTGSFVAGEISEDGMVDDLQKKAGN